MARRFPMAMSQAPGLRGTPDSGHCSSAATSASWASSSARPTSRTIRARPAMTLADSILQTASIARCASEAVMATSVRALGHLADLYLDVADRFGKAPGPLDRLFLRPHLQQREPADHFLRLGEGPVDHGALPTGELDVRTRRA